MPEFLRVTDDVKPKREYTIVASAFDETCQKVVDKPAASPDGQPLPTKYAPESLSSNRGQSADTQEK